MDYKFLRNEIEFGNRHFDLEVDCSIEELEKRLAAARSINTVEVNGYDVLPSGKIKAKLKCINDSGVQTELLDIFRQPAANFGQHNQEPLSKEKQFIQTLQRSDDPPYSNKVQLMNYLLANCDFPKSSPEFNKVFMELGENLPLR